MSNPTSKILPNVLATFAVVFVFFSLDAFAPMLMSDITHFGTNVIGAGLGLVTIAAVCFSKQRSLESIGLVFDFRRILRGFVVGGSMSTAPIIALYGLKCLAYVIFKFDSFKPDFISPSSPDAFSVTSVVVYGAACCITALMQELTFRGFVVRSMRPQYPFLDANLVQALLSVTLPLVLVIRNLVFGHYNHLSGIKKIVFIVSILLFYIVYTFISSIKRGVVTRVSGDIWPSFFGNFAFLFLGGCLFIQNNMIKSFPPLLLLLVAEFISSLVARKYYQKQYIQNKKSREERERKIAERIEKQRIEELNRTEDPNVENLTQKSVQEIMQQHNKKLIDSLGSHSRAVQPESDDSILNFNEVKIDEEVNP